MTNICPSKSNRNVLLINSWSITLSCRKYNYLDIIRLRETQCLNLTNHHSPFYNSDAAHARSFQKWRETTKTSTRNPSFSGEDKKKVKIVYRQREPENLKHALPSSVVTYVWCRGNPCRVRFVSVHCTRL